MYTCRVYSEANSALQRGNHTFYTIAFIINYQVIDTSIEVISSSFRIASPVAVFAVVLQIRYVLTALP